MSPKIGLAGQLIEYAGSNVNTRAAQVTKVHSPTEVDARRIGGTSDLTNVEFVDVGCTPPAAPTAYFQAIDAVS